MSSTVWRFGHVFSRENQAAPPSLSLGGKLRLGTKADLLECFGLEEKLSTNKPVVDAKFIDGAAAVQMMHPGTAKTFQDYADAVFLYYVSRHLEAADRVDVVRDIYIRYSLKGKFLSQQVKSYPVSEGKVVYVTDEDVLSTMANADMTTLAPSSHEETDTHLLLSAVDAVQSGHKKLLIRTVDTEVVVLAIAKFNQISPDKLWLAFGTKSNFSTFPFTKMLVEWIPGLVQLYQSSTHSLDAIQIQHLGAEARRQPGRYGKCFLMFTEAFEYLLHMENDISKFSTVSIGVVCSVTL